MLQLAASMLQKILEVIGIQSIMGERFSDYLKATGR